MERYTRAEYILGEDPAKVALADVDREQRLYLQAAEVLRSAPMAELDFSATQRALEAVPALSDASMASSAASSAYVALRTAEASRYADLRELKETATLTRRAAETTANDIRELVEGLNTADETQAIQLKDRAQAKHRLEKLRLQAAENKIEAETALAAYSAESNEAESNEADDDGLSEGS